MYNVHETYIDYINILFFSLSSFNRSIIIIINCFFLCIRMCLLLQMAAQHFSQNAHNVFMMRIAVGLINLGKGTLSLSPFQFDSRMMNSVAVSGLIITLFSFLDIRNS